MNQTLLAHWGDNNRVTHSQLVIARDRLYKEKGPGMIKKLQRLLADLTQDDTPRTADFDRLSEVNDLSLNLGAMNPTWNEFSVAVFHNLMAYNQLSARAMLNTFKATLRKIHEHQS